MRPATTEHKQTARTPLLVVSAAAMLDVMKMSWSQRILFSTRRFCLRSSPFQESEAAMEMTAILNGGR